MPWTYCVSTNFDSAVAAQQDPVSFVDATPQRVQKAEERTAEKPQTFAESTSRRTLASALLKKLNISIE